VAEKSRKVVVMMKGQCPNGHGKALTVAVDGFLRCKCCSALVEGHACDECTKEITEKGFGYNSDQHGYWYFCSVNCLSLFIQSMYGG